MEQTMADEIHSGSCLCGGVRYQVVGALRPVQYCHCSQCRKTSGNFVGATACARDDFRITCDETLSWYRASDIPKRGFCSCCGGNLFWNPDHGRHMSIFAGTLDQPTGLSADSHIFVDDKADYVSLNDGLNQYPQSD